MRTERAVPAAYETAIRKVGQTDADQQEQDVILPSAVRKKEKKRKERVPLII